MKIFLDLTVIVNIILLLLCIVGSYVMLTKDLRPHAKAKLATIMVFFLFLYCILMFGLFGMGIITKHFSYVFAILFVILPFLFGKFVQYKTLKKYTIFQILSLFASLFYLLM